MQKIPDKRSGGVIGKLPGGAKGANCQGGTNCTGGHCPFCPIAIVRPWTYSSRDIMFNQLVLFNGHTGQRTCFNGHVVQRTCSSTDMLVNGHAVQRTKSSTDILFSENTVQRTYCSTDVRSRDIQFKEHNV